MTKEREAEIRTRVAQTDTTTKALNLSRAPGIAAQSVILKLCKDRADLLAELDAERARAEAAEAQLAALVERRSPCCGCAVRCGRCGTEIARTSEDMPAMANRLKAELQALVGPEGPSTALIEDWKKRFPPPSARAARRPSEETKTEDSLDDLPSVIPNVSDEEHAAILIWALLHASGGTVPRMDLARAFMLRARPALLKKHAPTSLKREVAHWASTVGSRSVKAGLLASTLNALAARNGVALGTDSEGRSTVSASPHTPSEAQIDPWFLFEANLALKVLRAQPEEKFTAIDKAYTRRVRAEALREAAGRLDPIDGNSLECEWRRENETLRSNSDHLSSENAALASQVESMAMRIESLAEELAKPEDVRLREVLDALDGRAVIFDGLGARVEHLLDEMDEWIARAGEAERLAEERLAHANQLQADIEAEQQGRLALRKRLGARDDETMGACIGQSMSPETREALNALVSDEDDDG